MQACMLLLLLLLFLLKSAKALYFEVTKRVQQKVHIIHSRRDKVPAAM